MADIKKLGAGFIAPYKKRPFRAVYLFAALLFFALDETGVFRATWKEVAIFAIVFLVVSVLWRKLG
jgi:hypothetical protein